MSHEVAVRGVVIATWGALGAAITVAVHHRFPMSGARARRVMSRDPGAGLAVGPVAAGDSFAAMFGDQFDDDFSAEFSADFSPDLCADLTVELSPEPGVGPGSFDGVRFDDETRSALAACLFAAVPDDHIWWTIMVVDPALQDTPSHLRLVGHYEAELTAVDAADHLMHELNSCLVPGEARMTATAIGIEPDAQPTDGVGDDLPAANWIRRRGPVAHTGETISYRGTPIGDLGHSHP